jgi:peroxiredoxin Q/BCP
MPSTVTEKGARRSSTRLADRSGSISSAVVDSNAKRAADDEPAPSKAATKKAKSTADEPTPTVSMPKKLAVGDTLPALSLSDQAGKTVKIGDLKKAVIFTYPKANTGGCTAQACLYRDEYEQWQKAGFTIYGLSNDGQTSLKNWKEVSIKIGSRER